MFSIGEFSTASGITVRTLRFYHEIGLLVPAAVDPRPITGRTTSETSRRPK
jgi:DNA-binding transcriptional MerR regulator